MTAVSLPALDGRIPLGFLAGLGVLRLVTTQADDTARLAWSPGDCTAVLHSTLADVAQVACVLSAVVAAIPEEAVILGLPANFPPKGGTKDGLRLTRPDHRAYADRLWREGGPEAERWMASLVTDLEIDPDGRAGTSRYYAPSGQQKVRTMLEKPLEIVRADPISLTEALVGWRRQDGVTGEYLDHRVLFDAAAAPDGQSRERGVPGATWLALMSYPMFRTTATRGEVLTTAWQSTLHSGGRRRMVYPLWTEPLGVASVEAVLAHPVLAGAPAGAPPKPARAISVFLICAAERRRIPGRTFAGVLAPVQPETPDHGDRPRRGPRHGTAADVI